MSGLASKVAAGPGHARGKGARGEARGGCSPSCRGCVPRDLVMSPHCPLSGPTATLLPGPDILQAGHLEDYIPQTLK